MRHLIFFLEEPSARVFLEAMLPKLALTDILPKFIVFQGKQDMEKNLLKRLKGWRHADDLFLIMRDQDAGDCRVIKQRLENICAKTGKKSLLIRIACRELESFYLGDLKAVERGLKVKGLEKQQVKRKFRAPDALGRPSTELTRLTEGRYQKILGSRVIAPHMSISENTSRSFMALLDGIRRLAAVEKGI